MRTDFFDIDWRATRKHAREKGYRIFILAEKFKVNYGSLGVMLAGQYTIVDPNNSAFVQRVIDGFEELDLLVLKEDKRAAA